MRFLLQPLISLGIAALLAGCSRTSNEVRVAGGAGDVGRGQANSVSQPSTDADMVAAVSSVPSTTPISLRYRLADAPQVGQPVTVELVLITDSGVQVTRLHLAFRADEGLELRGSPTVDVEEAEANGTLRRQLVVVPRRDGVLQLHATAVVDTSKDSVARVYSIPLIANGPAAPAG
jgi:hypothetical protein